MSKFIGVWITIAVAWLALSLAYAIFSPVMNNTLDPLVDDAIYNGQSHSGANGDQHVFYDGLFSSKTMVTLFFNLFGFAMGWILIIWGILSALRREEDSGIARYQ
jgi:hypothetical protein